MVFKRVGWIHVVMFVDEELETVSVESRWRSSEQAAKQTVRTGPEPPLLREPDSRDQDLFIIAASGAQR